MRQIIDMETCELVDSTKYGLSRFIKMMSGTRMDFRKRSLYVRILKNGELLAIVQYRQRGLDVQILSYQIKNGVRFKNGWSAFIRRHASQGTMKNLFF